MERLALLAARRERALVLEEWNATAAEYPARPCIHELFEAQAARTPDAVAVVFEDAALTYARAERAREPAGAPPPRAGRGAGRAGGDLRGARRRRWSSALLAILKAGGAYVPLDPAYPAERLRYMLEDSAPRGAR